MEVEQEVLPVKGDKVVQSFSLPTTGWVDAEGVRQAVMWLKDNDLFDEGLDETKLVRRHATFSTVTFPDIPTECHQQCLKDLLRFEDGFAIAKMEFGRLIDPAFEFEVKIAPGLEDVACKSKPIRYDPQAEKWLEEYVDDLVQQGIAEPCDTPYQAPVILVPGGQSMQEYRVCMSYVKLNRVLEQDAGPCPDIRSVLDQLGQGRYFSVLDVKSGFTNVVVKPESRKYLGFVTRNGVFTVTRLPQGITTGPCHFQKVMMTILKGLDGNILAIYIDDVIVWGGSWEECWTNTLRVLGVLISNGLAINIGKATLCAKEAKVLGQLVQGQAMMMVPHPKSISPLITVLPPTTLEGVQQIYGLLNYFRSYCPNFEEATGPIKNLLAGGHQPRQWTMEHTSRVRAVGRQLLEDAKLKLPDFNEEFQVAAHVDKGNVVAVLLQFHEGHKVEAPVLFHTRPQAITEAKLPGALGLICALAWACQKFRPYVGHRVFTLYCQDVLAQRILHSPPPDGSLRQAYVAERLLELQCYNFILKPLKESKIPLVLLRHLEVDQVDHSPTTITNEPRLQRGFRQFRGIPLLVQFDGGYAENKARRKVATSSYVVFDPLSGSPVYGHGRVNHSLQTNNQAELGAVKDMVDYLVAHRSQYQFDFVDAQGDSLLIVDFFSGPRGPRSPPLARVVDQVKRAIKDSGLLIKFSHVYREDNKIADALCNVARESETGEATLGDLNLEQLVDNIVCYMVDPASEKEPCRICKTVTSEAELLCDHCNGTYHSSCVPNPPCQGQHIWYCDTCLQYIEEAVPRDYLLDLPLIRHLQGIPHPAPLDLATLTRVADCERWMHFRDGELYLKDALGQEWHVPRISQRKQLLLQAHVTLAHATGDRLYQHLRTSFQWHGMREDCCQIVSNCEVCATEARKWKQPQYLVPTAKPLGMFLGWSMDLITNLPEGPNGEKHVVVAVDCFSKWVEMRAIPDRSSATVAEFILQEILARYGKPSFIRTDQGAEFKGLVSELLGQYGIRHRVASTAWPRANGQVERLHRVTKAAFRKFVDEEESADAWCAYLPEVCMALRFLVTRSHGFSPFLVTFKQEPVLPIVAGWHPTGDYPTLEEQDEVVFVERLVSLWQQFKLVVSERLLKTDAQAVANYDRRQRKEEAGVMMQFQPGEAVMVKQLRLGKLKPKWGGPYEFESYSESFLTCTVLDGSGRAMKVSTAHVYPALQRDAGPRVVHRPSRKRRLNNGVG